MAIDTTNWIFEEAQLLDVRIDVLHSTVGALFEIRTTYLPAEIDVVSLNCGVMMFRKTTEVTWTDTHQRDRPNPQVWSAAECHIETSATGVEVSPLGGINGMDLLIKAQSVEFYAGRLPNLPADIPSHPDHMDVRGLVPAWEMDFAPTNVWPSGPACTNTL